VPPNAKLACVLADSLPVQVEQQRLGEARSLLIAHPIDSATVFALSDDVARAGVQVGMSLYQARQIAPNAQIVEPDEMAYHARHSAMEAALRAFSPAIETVDLGEFLVDARALDRTHGSDQAIAEAMCAAARSASGLFVRVGFATGKFIAQQAARSAPPGGVCVIAPGDESRFLAPLPIGVLPNLPGETRRRLHLLDLHTLGDLARLSKPAVLRQFGGEMSGLYELARGSDPRPINPDVPPLRLVRSLRLTEPVSERAILLNVTNRLSRQLSQALTERGYHAEALKLSLVGTNRGRWEVGQAVKPPTSDTTRLCRLTAQLLGRLAASAPVENVVVSVYPLRSWHLSAHQMTLADAGVSAKQTRLEETLQLLAHRFGLAVIRIAALLGPPLPLKVQVALSADGQPARLIFGGMTRVVMGIDESWREERFWWDKLVKRDYFRVVLGDGSLRNIFQNLLSGEWFLDRAWPIL
jgi:nucleotidyltransferase/DNA polymerase involved in DNA repair